MKFAKKLFLQILPQSRNGTKPKDTASPQSTASTIS